MSNDDTRRILAALGRLEAGQARMGTSLGASLEVGLAQLRVDLIARMDQLLDIATGISADIAAR